MFENPLAILPYASVWSLGFIFLNSIRFNGSRFETASFSLLSGLFIYSWLSFLLGLAGVPLTRTVFLATDCVLTVAALVLLALSLPRFLGKRPLNGVGVASKPEVWFIRIAVFILAFYFLMHAVINSERVISFTDAVMSYDFRAHAIAYEGKVHTSVYGWPEVRTPNFMYPPLTTMFHAHYYALGGKNPKLLFSLLLLAVSALSSTCVWRLSGNRIAAVLAASLTAFLPVVRKFSLLEALDFPALCYFAFGVVNLLLYNLEPRKKNLLLAGMGFAGVGFLRPEDPLFFAGVLIVTALHFGIGKRDWKPSVFLAFFYAAVYGSHLYFVRSVVGADPEGQLRFDWAAVISFERMAETLGAFLRHFSSDRFMLLGPVSVLLAVFGGADTNAGGLLKKLLLAFCVCWIGLLLADNSGDWKEMRLEWSHFRIFIRITPLFVLYAVRHPAVVKGLEDFLRPDSGAPARN